MINKPSVEAMTNDELNRYELVIATAKCARIITDEYTKQREYAERVAVGKDADKKNNVASLIKKEYRDEKAVKNAIGGLYTGEFKLIECDGTEKLICKKENIEEKAAEETAEFPSAELVEDAE